MGTRSLQSILNSGEILSMNMGGTSADDAVMTRGQIQNQLQPDGLMIWRGEWLSDQVYAVYDVVRDGAWLAIANKTTQQKPAPVAIGSPKYSFNVAPDFAEITRPVGIHSGHVYKFTRAGWITQLLVNAPEIGPDIDYRVYVINNTNPAAPVVEVINDPNIVPGVWSPVKIGAGAILPGTELIVLLGALKSSTTRPLTGGWSYVGETETSADPGPASWSRNGQETILRINNTDLDETDHGAELRTVLVDTVIRFEDIGDAENYKEYLVLNPPIDHTTWTEYNVALYAENGIMNPGTATILTADVPVPDDTKYFEELDHYDTHGQPDYATVEGYIEYDGVPQVGVENNAYGVALYYQEATISEDWEFLAYSDPGAGGGPGGGGGGGGTYDFINQKNVVVINDTYQEIARLTVSRAAGLYEAKVAVIWTLGSSNTSAFMRWSLDGGATWYAQLQSEPKDVTNITANFYAYPIGHEGGVIDFVFQSRKEVAGDEMTINDINLIIESKP